MNKRGLTHEVERVASGTVTDPRGFTASGLSCGIKKNGKLDLGWLYSSVPADAAAVYTTNQFIAAPLIVNRESIGVEGKLQAVLVNSGVANACTGERGLKDAYSMRKLLANHLGFPEHLGGVLSTGVIGDYLPVERIATGVASVADWGSAKQSELFAQAIMTTDTITKQVAVTCQIDGKFVTIGGAAKGSGMINPNMATMLGFVTTDAAVCQKALQGALSEITADTFNMIAVDGDTSTNDMVVVLANGLAENALLSEEHQEWGKFYTGLTMVCQELAKQIARDGEGATKLIEVTVEGAPTKTVAQGVAKTIILSNLVKSAVFGKDANWGRIVCAVGYSGQSIDPVKVGVSLGPIPVVKNGEALPFDEAEAMAYLENEHITIGVDLGLGMSEARAFGCDLTYDYVRINAAYRT